MNTVVVWILILVLDGVRAGGPLVVDNISSKENCEAVAVQIEQSVNSTNPQAIEYRYSGHKCIAVRKVK